MQLFYKMEAWITRYVGSKSSSGTARNVRQKCKTVLTVHTTNFDAKSHVIGNAKHASNDWNS